MLPGFVVLSSRDADVPAVGCLATCSKDEPGDDGGRAIGAAAAKRGALWTDRPFFTGKPPVLWIASKGAVLMADGCRAVQAGNEPNLADLGGAADVERWPDGPGGYRAWFAELRHLAPAVPWLHAPMSPSVPGWQRWVDASAPRHAVHAYGSFAEMRAVVAWYLDNTDGEVWVTECNPGAGNRFDPDRWARDELRPFLDYLATEPRVRCCAYFAWRWDQSPKLPTSVDAAGSPTANLIREWRAPVPTPAPITRARILENAARYDGVPYVWGGDSPTGLDCSAYVSRCWEVPRRGTDTLGEFYDAITKDQLRPGDAMNLVTTRDPDGSGHIRLFEKWANADRSRVWVWEETMGVTPGRVVHREIAYDPRYQPVRRVNVQESPAPAPAPKPAADNGARFGELWALKDRLYAIGDELLAQPDPRVKRLAAAVKGHGAGLEAEVAEFTRG